MLKKAHVFFLILFLLSISVEALCYLTGFWGHLNTPMGRFVESLFVLVLINMLMYPVFIRIVKALIHRFQEICLGLDRIKTGDYTRDIQMTSLGGLFQAPDELNHIAEGINRMQLDVAKREQQLLFKQESMEGLLQLLTKQSDEIRENYEIYRIISEETNDGMITIDFENKKVSAIQTKKILGYEASDFEDSFENWMELVHPEERETLRLTFSEHFNGNSPLVNREYRMKSKDGNWHWFLTRGKKIRRDGKAISLFVGSCTYIETWKKAQESIYRLAYYNQVSNLPNRFAFLEALEQRIQVFSNTNRTFALVLLNLDRFKRVNDLVGHDSGDNLISQVADSLRKIINSSDFLGHLNGDEFVILVEVKDQGDLGKKVQTLVDLFKYSWSVEERSFHITASVGVATFPGDGRAKNDLLKKADLALAVAKESGGNVGRIYEPSMNVQMIEKLEIENALRKAVQNDEFQVYYQPKIKEDGSVAGFEALMRWIRAGSEVSPPSVFIPFAEETGLIVEMGDIVLRKVCQKVLELKGKGYDDLTFSINLSPVQFDDGRIVEKIRAALQQYDVSPAQLEMEITESLAMENFNYVNGVLSQLKSMGIRIALDDFGKGYSSLNYLKRLAIDTLKVDRDFIRDIGYNRDDEIILDHIISIAHALNLLVVAEGVETWEQFRYLAERHCNEYQGYLFSKPVPPEQVLELLERGFPMLQESI